MRGTGPVPGADAVRARSGCGSRRRIGRSHEAARTTPGDSIRFPDWRLPRRLQASRLSACTVSTAAACSPGRLRTALQPESTVTGSASTTPRPVGGAHRIGVWNGLPALKRRACSGVEWRRMRKRVSTPISSATTSTPATGCAECCPTVRVVGYQSFAEGRTLNAATTPVRRPSPRSGPGAAPLTGVAMLVALAAATIHPQAAADADEIRGMLDRMVRASRFARLHRNVRLP